MTRVSHYENLQTHWIWHVGEILFKVTLTSKRYHHFIHTGFLFSRLCHTTLQNTVHQRLYFPNSVFLFFFICYVVIKNNFNQFSNRKKTCLQTSLRCLQVLYNLFPKTFLFSGTVELTCLTILSALRELKGGTY